MIYLDYKYLLFLYAEKSLPVVNIVMAEGDDFDIEIRNMDDFDVQKYRNTFEYNFAVDLIRYVLGGRMQGLHWKPEGIFEIREPAERSASYTPEMSMAVRYKLDRYENVYHETFDSKFPEERVRRDRYEVLCKEARAEFLQDDFSLRTFFRFVVVLAKYAGLGYLFGITDAPDIAHKIIVAAVRRLRQIGEIGEDFPKAMLSWLEDPELTDFEDVSSDDQETSSSGNESDSSSDLIILVEDDKKF